MPVRVGISLLTLAPSDLGGLGDVRAPAHPRARSGRDARVQGVRPRACARRRGRAAGARGARDAAATRWAVADSGAGALGGPLPRRSHGPRAAGRRALRAHGPSSAHEPADGRHPPRRAAPRPARVLRARPPLVPPGRLRPSGAKRDGGDRDERVRQAPFARAPRARPGSRPRRPARDRPLPLPPRRRRARALRPLPRTTLAAQEPRPAHRGVRELRKTRPRLAPVLTGGGLERLDPLPEGVTRLGTVSSERIASLYRRAACLVFPSLYEGFGLPPLEAMACGCPVAAADAGAIPGGLRRGRGALRPDGTGRDRGRILEADTRAGAAGTRPSTRAARFSWEETARLHELVYADAGAGVTARRAGTPTTP